MGSSLPDVKPEDVPEGSENKYCDEHEIYMFKNAMGKFVCPFCRAGWSDGDNRPTTQDMPDDFYEWSRSAQKKWLKKNVTQKGLLELMLRVQGIPPVPSKFHSHLTSQMMAEAFLRIREANDE